MKEKTKATTYIIIGTTLLLLGFSYSWIRGLTNPPLDALILISFGPMLAFLTLFIGIDKYGKHTKPQKKP